jgi:hypothetical protein
LIDWGSGNWLLSGPWQLFTTNSVSFNGAGPTSAPVSFVTPRFLISVRAYNGGGVPSTVTLSCDGNPSAQTVVPAGQVVTIPTNWTKSCTNAVIGSSNGWNTNFDDWVVH